MVLPFFAFRLMVVLGVTMVFLALWAVLVWARKRLRLENAHSSRWFLRAWVAVIPFGVLATEFGWIVREVGRQPWIIFGLMRTEDGVSALGSTATGTSLALFAVIYLLLFSAFLFFAVRILRKGPDLSSPLPARKES